MPNINSTQFGSVVIDNKKYNQVLIINDSIIERDYNKLEELFGTSHKIGNWERDELLKGNPEAIIIGTGQSGAMEVDQDFIGFMKEKNIEVIIAKTLEAIEIYNKQNKKVNALIHTTC